MLFRSFAPSKLRVPKLFILKIMVAIFAPSPMKGMIDCQDLVANFQREDGEWDTSKMAWWLPNYVIERITSAHPPREERGEDKYYWKPSSNIMFVFLLLLRILLCVQVFGQ